MEEGKYVYVGSAKGRFETEQHEKRDYANMYVFSAVSAFKSEDYEGYGYKAEKLGCVSPAVFKDLIPGEIVELYFDSKKRVALATSTGDFFRFVE